MTTERTRPLTKAEQSRYFEIKRRSPHWKNAVKAEGDFLDAYHASLDPYAGLPARQRAAKLARAYGNSRQIYLAAFKEEIEAHGFRYVKASARTIIQHKE